MTTHRHALMLLSAVGLVSGCDQPRPRCTVAPGDFAVRYEKLSGDCGDLIGDVLSLQVYYEPRSSKDMSPDYTNPRIALLPQALAGALAHGAERGATPNSDDESVAFGRFASSKPDDDDYCRISTMATARVRLPAIPEEADMCGTLPAEPAVDEQYDFSNVQVYNAPGAYGTMLRATLRYRSAGCSDDAIYAVTGIYPAIPCGTDPVEEGDAGAEADAGVLVLDGGMDSGLTDTDGSVLDDASLPLQPDAGPIQAQIEEPTDEETCPAPEEPGPMQIPDDGSCGPGSGISPEFSATCDPALLLCTIASTRR